MIRRVTTAPRKVETVQKKCSEKIGKTNDHVEKALYLLDKHNYNYQRLARLLENNLSGAFPSASA